MRHRRGRNQVGLGIDRYSGRAMKPGLKPGYLTYRSTVTVRVTPENQDSAVSIGHEVVDVQLVVFGVDSHLPRSVQPRLAALDDSDWRWFAFDAAAEDHDRARLDLAGEQLVMNRVVSNTVR